MKSGGSSRSRGRRRARLAPSCAGKDAIFAWWDPLPFLMVHHLQIPALLLGNLRRGRGWTRIDFNIGKLVEPAGTGPDSPIASVLHLVGSAVDEFHADLSRLYAGGLPDRAGRSERYDVHLAYVAPDGRWRFPADLSRGDRWPPAGAVGRAVGRGQAPRAART